MWDTIQVILLLGGYIAIAFFVIKFISKLTVYLNLYLRLLTLSFLYALFWGLGFAANGGDPGFAFPAPNVVALAFMASIGFYRGMLTGLIVFGFWWTIIFAVMLIKQIRKKMYSTLNDA